MTAQTSKTEHSQSFVQATIDRCQIDKGLAAALKRADNPATEYQCWEYLAAFQIDLEKDFKRLPYAAIAAAIARSKPTHNGDVGIGRAIALCYDERHASDQAKAKLRRLLACESVAEACRILRPLFSLIDAKAGRTLNYARLLKDLLEFRSNPQRIRSSWAQDFYPRSSEKEPT